MAVGTGILSKGITLGMGAVAGTYVIVPDLQEIPELGGDVEKVEVTTLADSTRRYINGLKDYGDLAFTFLYDNDDATASYRVLKAAENTLKYWEITLPDTTSFEFSGYPSVKIASAGINAPLTFTLSIALQSEMTVTNPA